MFGSNKKETTKSKSSTIMPSSTSHSLNSLVAGTTIEGTVNSESDIRIDGTVKGNLNCKAKVIIGPSGFVEGEIRCQNAVIEGKMEGKLFVNQLLNIRESAHITGEVLTDKLLVQSGATFNVTCQMGKVKQVPSNGAVNKPSDQKEKGNVKASTSSASS